MRVSCVLKKLSASGSVLLGLCFFALSAAADQQPFPYAIITQPSRCPLSNCSISSGGTAQTVLNANPGRKMFCLSNPASATEALYFDFGQAASTTLSLSIAPGALTCMGGAAIWQGTVSVNAVTGGHQFSVVDFQ